MGVAGIVAGTSYSRTSPQPLSSQAAQTSLQDFIEVETGSVVSAHTRSFQVPSGSSSFEQINSLYWVSALGLVLQSDQDIKSVLEGSYRSLPEWYVADHPSMVLGRSFEASLGGDIIGTGTNAWYWDVSDPEEEDAWKSFSIGCIAVWSDRQLLLMWGCAAMVNPLASLFELAASTYAHWDAEALSLLPRLEAMPIGMVLVDDNAIDLT